MPSLCGFSSSHRYLAVPALYQALKGKYLESRTPGKRLKQVKSCLKDPIKENHLAEIKMQLTRCRSAYSWLIYVACKFKVPLVILVLPSIFALTKRALPDMKLKLGLSLLPKNLDNQYAQVRLSWYQEALSKEILQKIVPGEVLVIEGYEIPSTAKLLLEDFIQVSPRCFEKEYIARLAQSNMKTLKDFGLNWSMEELFKTLTFSFNKLIQGVPEEYFTDISLLEDTLFPEQLYKKRNTRALAAYAATRNKSFTIMQHLVDDHRTLKYLLIVATSVFSIVSLLVFYRILLPMKLKSYEDTCNKLQDALVQFKLIQWLSTVIDDKKQGSLISKPEQGLFSQCNQEQINRMLHILQDLFSDLKQDPDESPDALETCVLDKIAKDLGFKSKQEIKAAQPMPVQQTPFRKSSPTKKFLSKKPSPQASANAVRQSQVLPKPLNARQLASALNETKPEIADDWQGTRVELPQLISIGDMTYKIAIQCSPKVLSQIEGRQAKEAFIRMLNELHRIYPTSSLGARSGSGLVCQRNRYGHFLVKCKFSRPNTDFRVWTSMLFHEAALPGQSLTMTLRFNYAGDHNDFKKFVANKFEKLAFASPSICLT